MHGNNRISRASAAKHIVSLDAVMSYKVDPVIENLTFYRPNGNMWFPFRTMKSLREEADRRNRAHGKFFNYKNTFGSFHTNGSVYEYVHKYTDPCLQHYISLKYDANCGDHEAHERLPKAGTYRHRLLVVAVQRSGTHYTWEMLNRLGVKVCGRFLCAALPCITSHHTISYHIISYHIT
jgi:hypothetical protein